jgi:DNA-binding NarL/FixJ family response regulator
MTCDAERHGTYHFYRHYGCRCPAAISDRARLMQGVGSDPAAVQRALAGDRVRLGPADRRQAVAKLDGTGASAREIAERLRLSSRTIVRIRGRLREQQAA